ncbi:MAG: Rieske (2Fe-2S) protein [Frankiaceae bacterium]|nr:Rieske (2Fe-2S) protein [Frankiaceae bacterium]MBV9872686.1 Rieske (2Fe-2S) protein [Frankiaceae bacterium]
MPASGGMTDVVDRLEKAGTLDPVVGAVRRIVQSALSSQRAKDVLHGVWLGHPLHPSLTHLPIGAWGAAGVLDAMPGTGNAAATMIASGCVGYVPTIAAGWADWSELHEQQQRVGLVHATAGALAFTCYVASLAARAKGATLRGKAWSYAGLALVGVTGYLGGHLAFRQAAGMNHAEAVPHLFPAGWHELARLDDLPDGELSRREIDGIDLLVVRRGRHVDVLANNCSHLSAPLSEGDFLAKDGQGCVECPWHGSVFRLADGAVVHGPATAPMPRFESRVVDGSVEVMLPGAG